MGAAVIVAPTAGRSRLRDRRHAPGGGRHQRDRGDRYRCGAVAVRSPRPASTGSICQLSDRHAAEAALPALLPSDAIISTARRKSRKAMRCPAPTASTSICWRSSRCLTGGFLVYSAQSLSVVRRQRAFALLRTLGMPRRQRDRRRRGRRSCDRDGRSLCRASRRIWMAWSALHWFGGDLGAGYFGGGNARLVFQPCAALAVLLAGTARRGPG